MVPLWGRVPAVTLNLRRGLSGQGAPLIRSVMDTPVKNGLTSLLLFYISVQIFLSVTFLLKFLNNGLTIIKLFIVKVSFPILTFLVKFSLPVPNIISVLSQR